jgi:energy-converting hydrogenase Eha subunit E
MKNNPKFNPAFLLFAALPVVFFLLFGFHGMDAADRGFIPALAYRILSGEVIYHDFYYVRPPLTPYLHTIEMILFPANWEMLAYRFFFYAFMWLSIFWSLKALQKFFDFEAIGVSPWLLGAIAYVLSVHNFFAAPWHTLDGIVFASLGFFLIARSPKLGSVAAGLFCLGLAAMAKQPFGIVPVVGVGLVFLLYDWKKALLGTLLAVGAAGVLLAVIELLLTPGINFTQEMLAQTQGVSSLQEMRWGGYQLYVRPALFGFGPGMLLWLALKYGAKMKFAGVGMAAYIFVGFAVVTGGLFYLTWQHGDFLQPKAGFYHALVFAGGMIAGITFFSQNRKGMALLLAMFAVAWASGISWGYAIPVLYCLPAVVAIAFFLGEVAMFKIPRWYWPSIMGIVTVGIFALNFYVYHDAFRTEITHDLGEVFPKLSHIKAGDIQYNRYVELKALHSKYGDNFTVLPSLPLANYLTDTKPVVPVDWAHDAELNYNKGISDVLDHLEAQHSTVFAMRDELGRANEAGHYRCTSLKYVLEHWTRVDSTSLFYVYQKPLDENHLHPPIH